MNSEILKYYTKDLPDYLKGNLAEEPRGIDDIYESFYFCTCTESCIKRKTHNHQVLYHVLYLAFIY